MLALVGMYFYMDIRLDTKKQESVQQEATLQKTVKEIMTDINNEDFVSARVKAETLYYTAGWSDDIEEKWDATRKELIKQIDTAEDIAEKAAKEAAVMLDGIRKHLYEGCIGSISEIFDGDAPHTCRGCYAQAWSVGEVLRAYTQDILPYLNK